MLLTLLLQVVTTVSPAVSSAPANPSPLGYRAIVLPGVPGRPDAGANEIALDGTIVGEVDSLFIQEPKPTLWAPPLYQPQLLSDLGSLFTGRAMSINNSSQVVGSLNDPVGGSYGEAITWFQGQVNALAHVGSTDADNRAIAINDSGLILGASDNRMVLWFPSGAIQHEATLTPVALNNLGHVLVAAAPGSPPTGGPRIWRNGVLTVLPILPNFAAHGGNAINESDVVVGGARHFSGANHWRAMRWTDNSVEELSSLRHDWSRALDTNNHGVIVGRVWDVPFPPTGVLWRNGQIHKLAPLVCGLPGGEIRSAHRVNDRGMILAQWEGSQGERHIALLPHRHTLNCGP